MKILNAKGFSILWLAFSLSGCAYYVSQTACIKFDGNIYTSREAVENDILYQAAKMTFNRGYSYFVLGPTDTYPSYHPCITWPPLRHHANEENRSSAVIIRMFSGWKPEFLPNAYYACDILSFHKINAEWNSNIHHRN